MALIGLPALADGSTLVFTIRTDVIGAMIIRRTITNCKSDVRVQNSADGSS
jgi:hypothetical protein